LGVAVDPALYAYPPLGAGWRLLDALPHQGVGRLGCVRFHMLRSMPCSMRFRGCSRLGCGRSGMLRLPMSSYQRVCQTLACPGIIMMAVQYDNRGVFVHFCLFVGELYPYLKPSCARRQVDSYW
jgi:hypothetical protein